MKTFKETVSEVDSEMTKKLCIEFEVAESTVKRWASGVAIPHIRLQNLILEFIKENNRLIQNKKSIKEKISKLE